MSRPKIVPELYCSDFQRSIRFYVDELGFCIRYSRPEELFAYLYLDGAELMIEQAAGSSRTLVAGSLEYPFGRGVNLQIEVKDSDGLYARVQHAGRMMFLPIEDRWYRTGGVESGSRQFVLADPDGYLLRFWHDLGERPVSLLQVGNSLPGIQTEQLSSER